MSTADWSPYPAFWDHKSERVVSVKQEPNAQLIARITPAKGRPLKDAEQVWSGAGRILLVERVRTNTHRVLAVGFDQEVLGNTWWALKTDLTPEQEKALLLWLNGTPTLLSVLGRRVVTEGAWMQMKKPAWASMPVLDVRALSETDRITLAKAYDRLASKELAPIAQLDADVVRAEIDKTLCKVLGLPSLAPIRELLAREPGLTAKDITPRRAQRIAEVKEAA